MNSPAGSWAGMERGVKLPSPAPENRPFSGRSSGLSARSAGLVFLAFLAAALAAGCAPETPAVFEEAGAPRRLEVRTYEGSGQVVHPDVVRGPKDRRGNLWMAITPYPDAYEKWENPSVYRSRDGLIWEEPAPLVNPVAPRPPFDHNCDPDLVRADGRFHLFWLETQRRGYGPADRHFQDLKVSRSEDGIDWSDAATVIRWELDRDPFYLSPTLVLAPDGGWRVYVVHGKTRTIPWLPTDLETAGAPGGALDYGLPGVRPWHVDIFPVEGGWVALLCARGPDALDNGDTDLWIGASPDLERWHFREEPLLEGGDPALGLEIVYRSTGLVEAGRLAVWYSGRTPEGIWELGVATFPADLVTGLLAAAGGSG